MARQVPKTPESETAWSGAALLELPKKRLFAKVGLGAGILATALTAGTAKPNNVYAQSRASETARTSHPLDYVGVTSNRIWVTDLDEARQAAHDIAATNANTVRIFEPYNHTQAAMDSDLPRLCNAAEAARENNLTLEISTLGYRRDKHNKLRHDYVAGSAGNVSRYLNFVKTMIMHVAGPNADQPGPDGEPPCVEEPLSKLVIEDYNEVNSGGFNNNDDPAKRYAYLESKAIPVYHKIVRDINAAFEAKDTDKTAETPHFTLVHAVGALAVNNHHPLQFLRRFDSELKKHGVTNPDFMLAVHLYPSDQTTNPAKLESRIYPLLRQELDSAWGDDDDEQIPIFYDEVGVNAISPDKRYLYGKKSLQAQAVSESTQGQYYKDTITTATMQDGVVGVLTFQSQDVPNDGWPASTVNVDGTHKMSWSTVSQANYDVSQGLIQK
jgi:hypothetical protein